MASSSCDTAMTLLLKDIAESISFMQKMTKSFGTTSDTIEERRKFTALKTSVQQQIVKATHKMNIGASNKNYENEFLLQEYADSFRKVVEIAVTQFRMYKAYNPPHKKANYCTFQESEPLLTNNPFHDKYKNNYYQPQYIQYDDETKILEENEEKMTYITEELTGIQDLWTNLGGIITDEQDTVDLIEASVEQSKFEISSGADQLIKAERKFKKIRCNRCVVLIGLLAVLSMFLIYLWITTKIVKK